MQLVLVRPNSTEGTYGHGSKDLKLLKYVCIIPKNIVHHSKAAFAHFKLDQLLSFTVVKKCNNYMKYILNMDLRYV